MAVKTGEYFVHLGKITREQLDEALKQQKSSREHIYLGELLVNEGLLTETDLLSYLAGLFSVQYISSEKLEKMTIQPNIAQIIPEKIAESKTIFPLKYNFNEGKLTLLTYEPQNTQAFGELRIILDNIKQITPVVAYSKAIKALIAKQYRGDLIAFDRFFPKSVEMKGFIPVGEPVLDKDMLKQDAPRKVLSPTKKTQGNTSFTQIINQGEVLQSSTDETTITNRINRLQNGITITGHEEFIEAIKVFTSIIDSIREGGFKNHTQRVVSLCIKLAKALKFNEVDLNDLILAAYLHDVGKKKHLSSLDLKDKQCADTFIKYSSAGVRLFAGCNLPKQTKLFLSNMYEVVNGEGLPQGLKGSDIPRGSQILLLADTFDFMTQVSGVPAATAFARLKAAGHYSEKIIDTLREELQIKTIVSTLKGNQQISGIVVSENRVLLDEIVQFLGAQNFKIHTAPQIEIAALILKKQGDSLSFVLADLDVKNSQYTPLKLVSAIRAKGIFSHIKFIFFSTGAIDSHTSEQAKQLKVAAMLPFFTPSQSISKVGQILEEG